jgi:hypothetical protein
VRYRLSDACCTSHGRFCSFFLRVRVKNETIEAMPWAPAHSLAKSSASVLKSMSSPPRRIAKSSSRPLKKVRTKVWLKAVGHCSITGTLGYDVNFIRMIPTPTGRKIRWGHQSSAPFRRSLRGRAIAVIQLTAGEFDINDTDKKKSSGVLYPQCQLAIDKEGQLQFQLAQNPWKLVDIIDWKALLALTSLT